MRVKKAATAAVLSACLATGLMTTVATSSAQAAGRKACVNKKSGELRILLKASKKCKKGWTKISFDDAGPTGATGPAGTVSVVTVKDARGAAVGQSLFSIEDWLQGQALVYTGEGAYWFNLSDGRVEDSDDSVYYTEATCSPANAVTSVGNTADYLAALNSFGRIVDRANTGPARAFKGTASVRATNPGESFWYLASNETCQTLGWAPDTIAVLQAVAAPGDRPGPLSFS